MIGTATASLLGFSREACPPRLKMPTLNPVLPRFRVGIALVVAELLGSGRETGLDWPRARSGRAAEPSAAAVMRPPALRKDRRLLDDFCDFDLLMRTSGGVRTTLNPTRAPAAAIPKPCQPP